MASSPPDGTTMYACSGHTVTLDWMYTLDSGDQPGSIQWHHRSNETVAISVGNQFFPTKPFVNYVRAVGNAGIILNPVINTDTGNYSVTVNVYDASGQRAILTRSAYVQVDGKC